MHIVIAFKINHDLPWSKMIGLPRINNLADDLGSRCPGATDRSTRTVQETLLSELKISPPPSIKSASTDPKVSTCLRSIMTQLLIMTHDTQTPSLIFDGIVADHGASPLLIEISL